MSGQFRWTAVVCLVSTISIGGCSDRAKFDRAPALGRVVCEGQPVAHAFVYFLPKMDGKKGNVGKFGVGPADKDGNFVISTYDTNDGAVVGKHTVRVGRPKGDVPPDFKCDCVLSEEIDITEVEVVAGKNNLFEIAMKKATPQEAARAKKAEAKLKAEQE